ncbi:MAG: aspartate kinase [Thermoplasmata archaeon]|nr:aspartate kinase [Thermoplasmata archaeon]
MNGPVVLKFGGAALSEPARVVERVRAARGEGAGVVVVASARAGITDLLAEVLARPGDEPLRRRALARLESSHRGLPEQGTTHLARTARLLGRIERDYPADRPLGDRLLSQGERLSATWLAGRLRHAGIPAVAVEADHLGLMTDNSYGASSILLGPSQRNVRRGLQPILRSGRVPVVTGFFGRSQEGRVAVLGRGGSDYSATAIGAALRARRVELVKRDVAIFTADPKRVPDARPIRWLTYEEAEELAQFGARVLHPLSIEPARHAGVQIVVRSLGRGGTTTTIGPANGHRPIRAITSRSPLKLFHLRVAAGGERPGVAAEVTERLAAAGVNLVTLFTSASMLSVVVEPAASASTLRALAPMTGEPGAGRLERPRPVALVAAIGRGVTGDVLRRAHRILRGAEGVVASPRSISMVIPLHRERDVVRGLHRTLVRRRG